MSKADGWEKHSAYEWRKSGPTFSAEIAKLTGGVVPCYWYVYPLPRADHLDERGRYNPIRKGSHKTLAGAKSEADACIEEHTT